jgi:hypothetical protein
VLRTRNGAKRQEVSNDDGRNWIIGRAVSYTVHQYCSGAKNEGHDSEETKHACKVLVSRNSKKPLAGHKPSFVSPQSLESNLPDTTVSVDERILLKWI